MSAGTTPQVCRRLTAFLVIITAASTDTSNVFANVYGTFQQVWVGASGPFNSADAGDIDGDGDPDIVASNGGMVGWFKNNGQGTAWQSFMTIASGSDFGCITVFLIDFDQDGDLDIVGGRKDPVTQICHPVWIRNSANGTTWTRFDIGPVMPAGVLHWIEPADIDADGRVDVAYAHSNETGWFRNVSGTAPNFTFSKVLLLSQSNMPHYRCAHPVNLDADAALEIIGTVYYHSFENRHASIWGLPQGGRVDISTPILDPVEGAWTAWHADFDGDGDQDVAVCSMGPNASRVWRNDGNGVFTYHSQIPAAPSLRSGVFDLSTPVRSSFATGGIYKILNWTGSSWDVTNVATSTQNNSESSFDLGDMDLDGDLDVIGPNYSNGVMNWWRKP